MLLKTKLIGRPQNSQCRLFAQCLPESVKCPFFTLTSSEGDSSVVERVQEAHAGPLLLLLDALPPQGCCHCLESPKDPPPRDNSREDLQRRGHLPFFSLSLSRFKQPFPFSLTNSFACCLLLRQCSSGTHKHTLVSCRSNTHARTHTCEEGKDSHKRPW